MNRSETYTEDSVRGVMEEVSKLLCSRARVMVEGPEVVADSTEDLIDALKECQGALMALASIPGAPQEMRDKSRTELIELCSADLESTAEALGDFVDAAREALDDQGT